MSAETPVRVAQAPGLAARLRSWFAPRQPVSGGSRTAAGEPTLLVLRAPDHALADLQERLAEEVPDLRILSAPIDGSGPWDLPQEANRRAVQRWLEANGASIALWFGPIGPGAVLEALLEAQVPTIAVDVPALDPAAAGAPKARRFTRAILGHLDAALAQDTTALRSLRLVAPAAARIEILGHVVPVPRPPSCNSAERDELAQTFRARPVWLAAFPDAAEIPAILAAHRAALQGAHRLLLILAVESEREGASLAADLRAEGWRVARRGAEGEPDDTVEIFIADTPEEIGLWYRLAPITFLGGTLAGDRPVDPSGAAALGSALIVGPLRSPEATPDAALLERLVRGGGAYMIDDAAALAPAVAELMSPDRAAAHAHAAWDVASDGARVLDRIVTEVRATLRAHPE